jgi:homeobox protein cut-like
VLDWTQEYSLSHTTKQRLAWTSTKPEQSTIPPRVPKACLEPILTMADNKDEQASGGALTTNTPEDVKDHAGDIRSAREGAEEGNKFQQAVAAWRTLDLSKLVSTLDVAASELVSHQRDSLLKRKDLAQKTKDFKKLDDAAKLLDIKDLLKSYQGYIDVLTNHNKTISSAFMQAYTPLSEAPDPYPLLDASIDSLVTVEEVVPKLESENERLQKQLNKLNTQLEDSEKQLEEERNKRQSSEGSQDSRIKEVEQSWSAVLKEKEDNWTAKEQSLEEKVESQDRILKELKASYEVSQRLEKTGEETPDTGRNAATAAELELANSELERTSARLAEIEARNEQMRVELAQSASQSSGRSTAVEDEPAYLRLRSENSSLLRRIDNARYDKESETSALESKLRGIEREVNALKADRESLQTRVQKWSDYDEVKRELEMLRSIEFAAVDEADLEPSEAPSANGNADKSKGETLEQLLIARNKKLSNELTDLRVSNNELQKQLEELQEDFSTTNADLEKAQNLNASLENDLQRTQQEASNAFETMSVAGTYTSRFPKSAYGSKRGGGTSPTSSIIGGFDPSSGSGSPLRPGEGVGGGSGILPMVTAQRDRFKKKIGELEQELQKRQHSPLRSLKPAKRQPQPLRENTLRLDIQPRRPAINIRKRLRLQPQPFHHPSFLRQYLLRPLTGPLPLDLRKQHLPLRGFPRPRERACHETHELARACRLPDHASGVANADEQKPVCDVLPGAALAGLHHAVLDGLRGYGAACEQSRRGGGRGRCCSGWCWCWDWRDGGAWGLDA